MTAVLPETYAAAAAAIAGAVVIARKLMTRKQRQKTETLSRTEFHQHMESMRNRIGASYLALTDKIDANQKEVLAALAAQAAAFEHRIDQLESGFARVDERTRL